MELKVWVEGIQRIVCGVTDETTCQDVVYALACATGRTGRFTLTERWRNNERLLAPHELPLQVLLKWGEYSNDVQFILQYNGSVTTNTCQNQKITDVNNDQDSSRKSQGFSSPRRSDNVGVVKGVPKQLNIAVSDKQKEHQTDNNTKQMDESMPSSSQLQSYSSKACGQTPVKVNVRGSQGGSPNYHYNASVQQNRTPPSYRDPPDPSAVHARSLPPYREPPPPANQSHNKNSLISRERVNVPYSKITSKRNLFKDYQNELSKNQSSLLYSSQYRDLVRLINYQREKLSVQQAELSKCDAEIIYWETKTREQQLQMDALAKEAASMDVAVKQVEEQLRALGQVEEEAEISKQQDRTLRSELTLLRSKLANCETELLLCKNKIRLLMDEIQMEQKLLARESEERDHIERSVLSEVDRLHTQVEQAKRDAEMATQIGDTLRKEVAVLEATIAEKKHQVEKLVTDMKEANLQSLAISPPEELKLILEGPHKPGSTRKIIGSPRQLENAVPTSKNPHGVWV